MNKFLYHFSCILLAVGFSPLSSDMGGSNIKLPFVIIGIFLLIITNQEMARILSYTIKGKSVKIMIFLLFIMGLIGIFTGEGELGPVLQDFMAIFFFSFFFLLRIKLQKDAIILANFIELFFIYITCFEFVVIITGISGSARMTSIRVINLVVCPFFLSLLYLNKNKPLLSILFFVVCALMTIRSSMRINFFFPIIYILFLLYTVLKNSKVPLYGKIFITISIIGLIVYSFPIVQAYIEADASRNLHMVSRTEAIFDDGDAEETRVNTNRLIIKEVDDFILPQGLGYANHTRRIMSKYRAQYGVMSTMDSNLLYCVYHFGFFLGVGVLLMIIGGGMKLILRSFSRQSDNDKVMAAFLVVVILVMFVLKSWIFVYSSYGLTYGLLYAYAKNAIKYKA